MLTILQDICAGKGRKTDIDLLLEMSTAIKSGFALRTRPDGPESGANDDQIFPREYEAHINERKCPAGVCKDLIRYNIMPDACNRLHGLREEVPGRRHIRREEETARDRPGALHQVRRLLRNLQIRRD